MASSSNPNFVHLHLHTDYSLLDGACEIGELTEEAARRGMPAVAVTDHGNLFAAANFYHKATTHGVKPIIGCEMYVAPDGHKSRGTDAERSNHLVLLCESDEGYQNLIKLVSTGYLDGFYYKPRVDHELLAKHSKGIIALSACLRGEVADAIMSDKYDTAKANAHRLRDIFGKNNFFLEVQDQGLEQDIKVNRDLLRLSKESGIPLVATNDTHYLTQSDSHAQEVLMCIQTGKTMTDESRMKFATDQFYFKTAEEMYKVFGNQIPDALTRTLTIAERCNVKIQRVSNPFPEFKVPEGTDTDSYFERVVRENFQSRAEVLERLSKQGLLRHSLQDYETRLSDEIRMIQKMRFAGYFLIVWDFIRYSRAQGVAVGPGRGSAAGSLVSYALRITDVDPLQYDLLFERFLNPERISMPDIDIDFCMRRRGEVIEYVRKTYGSDSVAQIITFGTMAAKAVLKDAGRALDMPYGEVDRLAKMIPPVLNISLEDALKQSPQLEAARKEGPVKQLVEVALRLEGLARHASTHAAGVVISPRPLTEIVPLYKSNKEEISTQYDMNALERIGLLKMDFLGLTTLTILEDAVMLIEQNRGVKVDLAGLGLDDEKTYQLFAKGDTTGIFQFESHGMRDILKRYQPTRLEDLTALNALYRPGPIQGGMIDDFIARKHGKKKVKYDLPELEAILSETWGVILYQEQVMQIANRLAGFSLGDADLLRRAMGKKKHEEMAAQREKFLAGCAARKVAPEKAGKIFDLMAEFAGYGFNKSHSCAYALLAYQTAYLKAHFPVEFTAAMLSSEAGNTEKVVKYINEARGIGIRVLPPDISISGLYFTPVQEDIRFGLAAIKNVGENTAKAICEARAAGTKFDNLFAFCEAIEPKFINKRVLESLTKAGALDCLGGSRGRIFAAIDTAISSGAKKHDAAKIGQGGLFLGDYHASTPGAQAHRDLPWAEDWTEEQMLAGEYSVLGFYISGHPLDKYSGKLKELNAAPIDSLEQKKHDSEVIVGGIIVQMRPMRSKRGARWAILTLQDQTGVIEALAFPEAFGKLEQVLKTNTPLLVKGRVAVEDVGTRLIVADARALEALAGRMPTMMRVRIPVERMDNGAVDRLHSLFSKKPGRCRVAFEMVLTDGTAASFDAPSAVLPDKELLDGVRAICGPESVAMVQ
jgi:DNA polymerase-3 subunit alpha